MKVKECDFGKLARYGFKEERVMYVKDLYDDEDVLISLIVYKEKWKGHNAGDFCIYASNIDEDDGRHFDIEFTDDTVAEMVRDGIAKIEGKRA
jgi:hypothetical protein